MRIIICIRKDGARSTINLPSLPIRNLKNPSWSMYAVSGRKKFKTKANICCFYDVILLFKSIQGEGCLKITESERTYVLDGPLHFFQTLLSFQHAYIVSRCFLKKKSTCYKTSVRTIVSHHLVHFQLKLMCCNFQSTLLCCYFSLLFLTK